MCSHLRRHWTRVGEVWREPLGAELGGNVGAAVREPAGRADDGVFDGALPLYAEATPARRRTGGRTRQGGGVMSHYGPGPHRRLSSSEPLSSSACSLGAVRPY